MLLKQQEWEDLAAICRFYCEAQYDKRWLPRDVQRRIGLAERIEDAAEW